MFTRLIILCVAFLFSGICIAQERKLFGSADLFGPERESRELNQSEKEMIRLVRSSRAVRKAQFVVIDLEALDSPVVTIDFPPLKMPPLRKPAASASKRQQFWVADVAGDPDHSPVLRIDRKDGSGIFGMIRLPDGSEYSIRPVRGRTHLLEQFDRSSVPDHALKVIPESKDIKLNRTEDFIPRGSEFVPGATQPSQKLFERNDHLPRADEKRILDSEEDDVVTRMRGRHMFVKDVKVFKRLNLNALYGKAITIVMPDGEEVTYVGEAIASSDSSTRSWIGLAPNRDGHLAISASAEGVDGDAAYKGRSYVIRTLPKGQRFMFAEIKPLGLHQGEPASNFAQPSASSPRSK